MIARWAFIILVALVPFHRAFAAEASLYVLPSEATYSMGETFDVKIMVDSGGAAINAAEADLTFNTTGLAVVRISSDNSILGTWSTAPTFSNSDGTIRLVGWTKKDFSGRDGLLATITFKALRNMTSNARFVAGAILATDGQESNIISSMKSGVYKIQPREVYDTMTIPTSPSDAQIDATVPGTEEDNKAPERPAFSTSDSTFNVGDHIIVKGNADPNTYVSLSLAYGDGEGVASEIMSAADGTFTYVSDAEAKAGLYHLTGAAVSKSGKVRSLPTSVDLLVKEPGLSSTAAVGASLVVSLISELMPFFILIVLASLSAGYLMHRHALEKMKHGRR